MMRGLGLYNGPWVYAGGQALPPGWMAFSPSVYESPTDPVTGKHWSEENVLVDHNGLPILDASENLQAAVDNSGQDHAVTTSSGDQIIPPPPPIIPAPVPAAVNPLPALTPSVVGTAPPTPAASSSSRLLVGLGIAAAVAFALFAGGQR